jgi:arginine decarboxylase
VLGKTKVISVTYGTGVGATSISAFDSALLDAGVGNYNLIHLSSVIPPHHTVVVTKIHKNEDVWGERLYCVYADNYASEPGESAWAGLAWVTTTRAPYSGLFLEERGPSKNAVAEKLARGMSTMIASRPNNTFGKVTTKIVGVTCKDEPVCAIVLAYYYTEPWVFPIHT